MYPLLHPGSLLLIDESRRRIANDGWTSECDRPIYFLELREGFRCGWCTVYDERILVQPHPSSIQKPGWYAVGEVDVIGQITRVAMLEPQQGLLENESNPSNVSKSVRYNCRSTWWAVSGVMFR